MSTKRSRTGRVSRWDQVPTWLQAVAALLTVLVTIAGIWLTRQGPGKQSDGPVTTVIPSQGDVSLGITAADRESKKPLRIRYQGISSPINLVKDLQKSDYDIYVMIRPPGGNEDQWIFSDPADVQSDGSWSARLETAASLDEFDERAALIYCLNCYFLKEAPPLEERIRASSEVRTVRL